MLDHDEPSLASLFDAVVMLTWSDWRTEPRSNRFHYASRFARVLPVFFVQPDAVGTEVSFEASDHPNVTIVHAPPHYTPKAAAGLAAALNERGVRRPLLWIYNVFFENYIARSNARYAVYHATENYLLDDDQWAVSDRSVRAPLLRVLSRVDLVVGVSKALTRTYRDLSQYSGRAITLANGCDFAFWRDSGAAEHDASAGNIALYQGGINARLDYPLVIELAQQMPEWRFWYCGHIKDAGPQWSVLSALPNVEYKGELSPKQIAELAKSATVGLIPFLKGPLIRQSLPLKAYEYVACGLPVVSVPIDALENEPQLFSIAETAVEFAQKLRELAPTRSEPAYLEIRRDAGDRQSYDGRFAELSRTVVDAVALRSRKKIRLNILVLYDDGSTHVKTIFEHLEAFQKYSRHDVFMMPITGHVDTDGLDFSPFDAVLIHYSVRVSILDHILDPMASVIARYDGPKLLFAQDEYEGTETARAWIERLGVDAVFTNVPMDEIEKVYPRSRFPMVDFVPTLTGYVPEDPQIDDFALPLAERKTLIAYRGRMLPYHYGDLGQQKYQIGVEVKRLSAERGLPVDVEVDDAKRIYGDDWYRFLGSARATLGTESGANIFDHDGSLRIAALANKDMPYKDFAQRFLQGREGEVRMNQVSPKIFESIRLRTALVLFEGEYSGVVKPDVHYLPLKADYSNFDDIVEKLRDDEFLRGMTDRAYRDVIATDRYSYAAFVHGVDAYLDQRTAPRRRARLYSIPIAAAFADQLPVAAWPAQGAPKVVSNQIIQPAFARAAVQALLFDCANPSPKDRRGARSIRRGLRRLWRALPMRARYGAVDAMAFINRVSLYPADERLRPHTKLVLLFWKLLPAAIRKAVHMRLGGR